MADLNYEEFATEFTAAIKAAWTSPGGFDLVAPWESRPVPRPYARLTFVPTFQNGRRSWTVQEMLMTLDVFPDVNAGGTIAATFGAARAAIAAVDAAAADPALQGQFSILRAFPLIGSPNDDPVDGQPAATTSALGQFSTKAEG